MQPLDWRRNTIKKAIAGVCVEKWKPRKIVRHKTPFRGYYTTNKGAGQPYYETGVVDRPLLGEGGTFYRALGDT